MQAVDLLRAGEVLTTDVAQRWLAAALAEAAALRDLDDQLYTDNDDPVSLARAKKLHSAWRQWAHETEALLGPIVADDQSTRQLPDIKRLRNEAAGARALIEQTPEMILERAKKAMGGDVVPVGEVRS